MLAGLDRRGDRALIDDLDLHVRRRARGDRHRDILRRDEADGGRIAALHLGLFDQLALGGERLVLPGAEAPVHERDRLLDALVVTGHAAHHHRDAPAILLRRADHREARFVGMPGLQAIGTGHAAEQRIAVRLGDGVAAHRLAPGEIGLGIELLVEIGEVADRRLGQLHHVARGDIGDAIIRPAVRGAEMAAGEAELLGILVHPLDERRLGARHAIGERDARVVARQGDDAEQQIGDADLLARREEHGRALAMPLLPGIGLESDLLIELHVAALDHVEHGIDRHRLGERGGRHVLIGILRVEHRTGVHILHERDRRRRVERRRFRHRRRGHQDGDRSGGDQSSHQGTRFRYAGGGHQSLRTTRASP